MAEAVDISTQIWDMKYRYKTDGKVIDQQVEDTWRRVARAVAEVETADIDEWEAKFYGILAGYRFLPGGRILANAGTDRDQTTMFNCYVMNTIPDSITGIFDVVKEAALTQKQGGGVGFDFSTIRPRGDHIKGVDSQASGPLSFMHVLDATCRTIMSAGQRRGAQMAIMRCDHPDIENFISEKQKEGALAMFNLSVAASDAFMDAVKNDADWDLQYNGKVYDTVKARELWNKIMECTYNRAEPGVVFIDRINEVNNLHYCETICATNPCGEQPLPPYGACLLGSLNLSRFVRNPYGDDASVDFQGLKEVTETAVRFLDNVIELSRYPLQAQEEEARNKRRMGIGITGLADLLLFLKLRYGSAEALEVSEKIMQTITTAAYKASAELAGEKGAFPLFDGPKYLKGKFVQRLPNSVRQLIRKHGIRNSHLTSVAPTGTISIYAGNVSSGLEPVFAFHYTRRIRQGDGDETVENEVQDYGYRLYAEKFGPPDNDLALPDYFVTSADITPREHILTQAALQKWVDSSISKTINVPTEYPFEDFKDVYRFAYDNGLKGCTTFRPSDAFKGVLLRKEDEKKEEPEKQADVPIPMKRPKVLTGVTYKIKTPLSTDALYVTINDIYEDGKRHPYELFINTKNLQHFSWVVAVTRLVSAVFRREKDPSFLVEEMKSIYDPNGGYFSKGRYIPSLAADIGLIIEEHLTNIGLMEREQEEQDSDTAAVEPAPRHPSEADEKTLSRFRFCPQCGERAFYLEENCWKCMACGYSKCS